MFRLILVSLMLIVPTSVFAACPNRAPNIDWNVHGDDQRVGKEFLNSNLAGKRVRYKVNGTNGTEHYGADGSYKYVLGSDTFNSNGYKFYRNGVRCIDYPQPRFDMYVVSNGKLLLINGSGGRYEGRLLR